MKKLKNIKIAFIDIDGTLSNSKKEVTKETIESIKYATKHGMYVVLCSGRTNSYVCEISKKIHASSFVISCNGAETYNYETNQNVFDNKIAIDDINTIWKYCPKKVVSRERYETADGYGREYIDVANLVNYWMTDDEKEILKIERETRKERQNAVICVLQKIFENNFSEIVMQYIGNKISPAEKSPVKLYAHQAHVLAEIYDMINKGKRNFITQLPPRFGKTLTWLTLFKESNLHRMMIVSSYVGTVSASYIKEVSKYSDFKNMIFINLDNFKDFEYNGEKIIIKFNTTGTTKTIAKRIEVLKKIIKKVKIKSNEIFFLNEEADYGQHTENSDEKFKMLMQNVDKRNESLVISTTGTEAFKAEKITAFGKFDGYLSVNKNDWSQIIKG